jgi:hypothetical protein
MRLAYGPFSVVILLSCTVLSTAEAPSRTINHVLDSFPGYHLLKLQERDTDTRAFLVQHFPKINPSVVQADLDGDGHADYALLLKNNKSGATKLVVLLCSINVQCKSVYELDVTADSGGVYIRAVPMGSQLSQTDAIDTNDRAPVKLRSVGIRLVYFEKAEIVLHWNGKLKKLEEIQTGD